MKNFAVKFFSLAFMGISVHAIESDNKQSNMVANRIARIENCAGAFVLDDFYWGRENSN